MHFIYLASFCLSLVAAQDTCLKTTKDAFDIANIPTDLGIVFNPSVLLEVSLPQITGQPITLHAGIHVPRYRTVGPPNYGLSGQWIERGPFVIAAVDPDAPSPQAPTLAQVRHFLGGNFTPKINGSTVTLTNSTPAITEFLQPGPPAGSDAHRYIFLLFKQPKGFNEQKLVNSSSPVLQFDMSEYAAAAGLGDPVGGTFMLVAAEA